VRKFEDRLFWAIWLGVSLVFTVLLLAVPSKRFFGVIQVIVPMILVLLWKLAGDASRRRQVSEPIEPLSVEELESVRRWGRLDLVAFFGAFAVGASGVFISTLVGEGYSRWVLGVTWLVILLDLVLIHLSGRCPRCGHRLGFDTVLGRGWRCGRCGVPLRRRPRRLPDSAAGGPVA
jgi:hypothetical protein